MADALPRIVCLDGYTLNPGDLDWTPIASQGEFVCHDRTLESEVEERIRGADLVLTNKTPVKAEAIESAGDRLRYIGVLATGVNVVDLEAAKRAGVTVTNVPGYSTPSVAQTVFALLLELASKPAAHDRAVHEGRWVACPDFSFTVAPIVELANKTLGVLGLGDIGQAVAKIGAAIGMRVIAYNGGRRNKTVPGVSFEWVELDELFEQADAVTLHCPLKPETQRLVNRERLKRMKRTAYLINTGRGPLVDEPALAEALASNELAGAGLDVLSAEPPAADNPLLNAPRCVITPHIGWASRESRQRLMTIVAENLRAFLDGTPQNVVN